MRNALSLLYVVVSVSLGLVCLVYLRRNWAWLSTFSSFIIEHKVISAYPICFVIPYKRSFYFYWSKSLRLNYLFIFLIRAQISVESLLKLSHMLVASKNSLSNIRFSQFMCVREYINRLSRFSSSSKKGYFRILEFLHEFCVSCVSCVQRTEKMCKRMYRMNMLTLIFILIIIFDLNFIFHIYLLHRHDSTTVPSSLNLGYSLTLKA